MERAAMPRGLQDAWRAEHGFESIIGESASLKEVLRQLEIVGPTEATVLIEGETGTGKELLARTVHGWSRRQDRPFVKLSCAAIPAELLESELFGHEKGAFTGAIAQKIGRFELADGGTLFLDEVGELPPGLQPKFLRVIQEQEFERLGSSRTVHVDVRLVAATNRHLETLVSEGEFRSDLYYRLKVFPIVSPPLRERREDIPLLVRYFTQKFAKRMSKRIETIPAETIAALSRHNWPGNIRELENFVERSVILSPGTQLEAPLTELRTRDDNRSARDPKRFRTLDEATRDHIFRALQQANWHIGGRSGAAVRLGMKRTTLQSMIARLGLQIPTPG